MEKGTIKSYDKNSGGIITRLASADVNFSPENILGKDRMNLKQGDAVWFEVENVAQLHRAINIRKCL